jgi:Ca2+/Na+ antiporter
VIIRFRTKKSKPPGRFMILFLFFSFTMSIIWISFAADVLIDLLTLFGIISGIDPSLLGMTVLAWGNSIGDMVANLSIARKGLAEMAITGCYAGSLFNILMGLGLTTLKTNLNSDTNEGIVFSIYDKQTVIPVVLMIGIMTDMILTLTLVALNKFTITKI